MGLIHLGSRVASRLDDIFLFYGLRPGAAKNSRGPDAIATHAIPFESVEAGQGD
jgi:hypothetical protein